MFEYTVTVRLLTHAITVNRTITVNCISLSPFDRYKV